MSLPAPVPLRVAVDARMRDHSGIGTYIRGLLRALDALRPALDVAPLDASRGLTAPIYGLREQIAVPRALARLTPPADLLHVPHYNAPVLLRARAPLVVTVHDLIHLRFPELARSRLARLYASLVLPRAVRRARAVICVSESTRRDLVAYVPEAAAKARVVHNGCDLAPPPEEAVAATLARLGLARGGYLLYVGNIRGHKNVDRLSRAYASLPAATRPPLVLAGDDQMPPSWEGRRVPGVRLLGRVAAEDLAPLYAGCLAFVFPSLFEGFGLPPLEAMACGAPVACSTGGSLAEVVGDAALLFEPTDDRAIATALERIATDAALREELRGRGRVRAASFTWEKSAKATLEVYRGAAAPSTSSASTA